MCRQICRLLLFSSLCWSQFVCNCQFFRIQNLGSKRKINLKHINSNNSSNAIQQRNIKTLLRFDACRTDFLADSLNNFSVILGITTDRSDRELNGLNVHRDLEETDSITIVFSPPHKQSPAACGISKSFDYFYDCCLA